MTHSLQETIEELHTSLKQYVEATYHISASTLIAKRERLLNHHAIIHQIPYLESTPRYMSGSSFAELTGLPPSALTLFSALSRKENGLPRILYDPPYSHQSAALQHALIEGKNLLIMTGTGSGKTESFLMPVLGKLTREAETSPRAFQNPAVRSLLLYPMNALVNDQLGRLRTLFGDPRVAASFKNWAGRPPRFARYTSRTPYAGVRTRQKDGNRLKPFNDFYVSLERDARDGNEEEREYAQNLIHTLKCKGKWPAKPDLIEWYGERDWCDRQTGEFCRAITLPDDTELLTRHEIQAAPPDLLVTNYSMLEYMLMRPIERPIFDATRQWLASNPDQSFLVVLDEAHLYRGAAGAEVGLLLRRLRARLDIPVERFQVICATASFSDEHHAPEFGAQLSGASPSTFATIKGDLKLNEFSDAGTEQDAEVLAKIDIKTFHDTIDLDDRYALLKPLLDYRSVERSGDLNADLYSALSEFPPMATLINETMRRPQAVADLAQLVFPNGPAGPVASGAVNALMSLGSLARPEPDAAGLLPCRIHNFFRGLPGLWVCMDSDCTQSEAEHKDEICGRMYAQPRNRCGCGAPVLELFTCRHCGTAYARAYTDNLDNPSALWSEPGERVRVGTEETGRLLPVDLLLEHTGDHEAVEAAIYDLETGRLNPDGDAPRTRTVYLRSARNDADDGGHDDDDTESEGQEEAARRRAEARRLFKRCAVCDKPSRYNRSSVQDHQTKGDQPFQAIVARQIQIQPPAPVKPTRFAPLQQRKVLAFSDSRQVAARLAPNLQMYSVRDSLRPLIAFGFQKLQEQEVIKRRINLSDLYLAVLIGAKILNVRLRPELRGSESFAAQDMVTAAFGQAVFPDEGTFEQLFDDIREERPPHALLADIVRTLNHPYWGIESLAIASLVEAPRYVGAVERLPDLAGIAETSDEKKQLVRAWLRCWQSKNFWLKDMPEDWWQTRHNSDGLRISGDSGRFKTAMVRMFGGDRTLYRAFESQWLEPLLSNLAESQGDTFRLRGTRLSLAFDGNWQHCSRCKSVHRPVTKLPRCLDCGSDATRPLNPNDDPVFNARKGFYRIPVMQALEEERQPMALIAAEHTAQLNASQVDDVFSKAEENELLFQDIELDIDRAAAVDILSSTTTMEVGIDLGQLSGVALRNMPPGRANYQQRAGRAGRRGNAVATVVAFGSADSHDEHYFSDPEAMIAGAVVDPNLTLDNKEIVQRHVRAFLIQNYHQDRLPDIGPGQPHDLFSVLGSVADFKQATAILNRNDFAAWLAEKQDELRQRVATWIPSELSDSDRAELVDSMISDCLAAVDDAIEFVGNSKADEAEDTEDDQDESDAEGDGDDPTRRLNQDKLLDRLLYCGKLPRYAFPTDVATFHVFERNSNSFRPKLRFTPSQGLPIALSQYAPGKQVWIAGKCYTSGALYSPISDDRFNAYQNRRIYVECSNCGFARTVTDNSIEKDSVGDCPACNGTETFGPARNWIRPPGFAHPIDMPEETSPDEIPETTYATRAKLTMGTPQEDELWEVVNERVKLHYTRSHLLVSNAGPNQEGYDYCHGCGKITSSAYPVQLLRQPHLRPHPARDSDRECAGTPVSSNLVLGTDFITDVALISMRVEHPLALRPGDTATAIALRTVCEALAKAGCKLLDIEPGELLAEHRPALTPHGSSGLEAEIFIYDTLPGGAGFASRLTQNAEALFQEALNILKNCPEGEGCDTSCYRCLRSFKNKFEHSLLDRHVGVELLSFLLTGKQPDFDERRISASTDLFFKDLDRQETRGIQFERNATVVVKGKSTQVPILATSPNGRQMIISLSAPLSPTTPADPAIAALKGDDLDIDLHVETETIVRGNLPAATRKVYQNILG